MFDTMPFAGIWVSEIIKDEPPGGQIPTGIK